MMILPTFDTDSVKNGNAGRICCKLYVFLECNQTEARFRRLFEPNNNPRPLYLVGVNLKKVKLSKSKTHRLNSTHPPASTIRFASPSLAGLWS